MAATGNEVVILRQLKSLFDNIKTLIGAKLDSPSASGTNGQMLVYGDSGNQWVDVPEGTAYSADNTTLQLTGTQFSVKDSGITAAKIANGTITADKLASGVIPDVSKFITETDANAAYQPKGSYLTSVPKATTDALGGIMIGYTEEGKNYPVELNDSGKAFVNVPWTDTDTTYEAATTSTDGLMSAADKTKLNGLKNYVLPEATSTTLGGVKVATDEDAKAFLGY